MEKDSIRDPLVPKEKGTASRQNGPQEKGKHFTRSGAATTDAEESPETTESRQNGSPDKGKHLTCSGDACPWMTTDAEVRSEDMKKLSRAVIFCLIFMLVEVVGGIKAGSLAILTDAAHLLSDVASFAISLFAIWAGGWEANARQTYGFFRLEILGALVSIQIIWLITGIIIYEALARLFGGSVPVDGRLMFIIAALGLVVNLVMMFLLDHGHGHSHGSGGDSHGHSHGAGNQHSYHHDHGHSHSREESRGDSHSELGHSHDHRHGDERVEGDDEHRPDHHDDKHVHNQDEAQHSHDHGHDGHHYGGGGNPHMDHSRSSDRMYQDTASILRQGGHNSECVRTNITRSPRSTGGDTIVMCICDEIEKQSEAERSVRVTIDHGGGDHEGHHHGSTGGSINVRGAYLHVLGDLIQSIGVMVGGAIIWYNPAWKIVDLICTFFFSILVLWTTIKMIRDILEVLMESTPREIDAGALEQGLKEIEGVTAVHELHIWAITVGKVVLACHVQIVHDADSDDLLQKVIQYCDQKYKISHVTVQIERENR